MPVDDHDLAGTLEARVGSHQSDRAGAVDHHRLTRQQPGKPCRVPSGRKDVGQHIAARPVPWYVDCSLALPPDLRSTHRFNPQGGSNGRLQQHAFGHRGRG